jgi:hypothetical protein
MTFATNITRSGEGVIWYARITGLPYVFSNHALPASWLTGGNVVIGGETRTCSATTRFRRPG